METSNIRIFYSMTFKVSAILPRTRVILLAIGTLGLGHAADLGVILGGGFVGPEDVEIFEGDTLIWQAGGDFLDVESYTGEWKSPILNSGETFSYTFRKAGRYVYRGGWYNGGNGPLFRSNPASVRVMPLLGGRPAISIASPPNGFFVHGREVMQAFVTNSPADVQAVQFFRGEELVATVTNPPYRTSVTAPTAGNYDFSATVIDSKGFTNASLPIVLTLLPDGDLRVFNLTPLPAGRFAFNYSLPLPRQPRPLFSTNLNVNMWREVGVYWYGVQMVLKVDDDPRIRNATSVFFKVDSLPQ